MRSIGISLRWWRGPQKKIIHDQLIWVSSSPQISLGLSLCTILHWQCEELWQHLWHLGHMVGMVVYWTRCWTFLGALSMGGGDGATEIQSRNANCWWLEGYTVCTQGGRESSRQELSRENNLGEWGGMLYLSSIPAFRFRVAVHRVWKKRIAPNNHA